MQDDQGSEVLTVAEFERRYPDEWVLIEIVKDHRRPERVKGRLIAHTPDREGINEPYSRFRATHPETRTYQFFTGDLLPKGVVVVL
jgi:hypothetical protein